MTGLTLRGVPAAPSIVPALFERQRALALYGLATLALGLVAFVLQSVDPRTLESGVGVWVKPAKFFVSVGIFSLTCAWFFGYVRPERRRSPLMRGTVAVLIASATFELAYICWQAAHGLESHFNRDTVFYFVMYALMGVGALALVATTLPLAWEIARRPAPGLQRSFVAAVVIGLVLTLLFGGFFGVFMSTQAGHAVGAEGGGVAVFGWNRLGGDLRVAHFFGIHAQQAIPLLAALTAGAVARTRWAVLGAGSFLYVALTVGVFAQALAGRALIPA